MLPAIEETIAAPEEGGTAVSRLPLGYEGVCTLEVQGRTKSAVVFPTVAEAIHAASFAVGTLGGYLHALVTATPHAKATHQSWTDWAF